jgi:GNAT superfamily N-acetyltransferase
MARKEVSLIVMTADRYPAWVAAEIDAYAGDIAMAREVPMADALVRARLRHFIEEEHRGKGYGRAAMLAAEQVVQAAGMTHIALNVFGFNTTARAMYDSLRYRVVSTQMTKPLA